MSMTENKIKEATFEDALYCAKALVGVERCEECRFYTLGDLWCDDTYRIMHEALEEVKAYRAIGTIEEFKALKERNEPKSVKQFKKNGEFFGQCKVCERDVFINEKYCAICGQKLDWQ